MKQRQPLKRAPFRRREGPGVFREIKPMADRSARMAEMMEQVARQPKPSITYCATTAHAPQPKGETARPGKRTPTKPEARWMAQIVVHGCIACHADGVGYVFPEVHHILRGSVRMGHLHTLPLCSGHHRKGAGRAGLIARHPDKAAFEARYGTEASLLERLRIEIGATA